MVSDGPRLAQAEQREARLPQPAGVPQLIRTLNRARRNNAVYVKLSAPDAGAVVHGEVLLVAAAVGAGRPRGRPQRRQLQPAVERDDRRMGIRDRSTR